MAFARVLFCRTKKWGTIPADRISHFSKKPFVKTKKYYYLKPNGATELIVISFVKDTLEEVKEQLKAKRCRIPPISKLASASEITDEDNGKSVKRARNKPIKIDTKTIFSERMAALRQKNTLKKISILPATCTSSSLLDSPVNSTSKHIDGEEYVRGEIEMEGIEQQMLRIHGLMETSQEQDACDKNNNNERFDNKRTNSSASNSSAEDGFGEDGKFKSKNGGDDNPAQQNESKEKQRKLQIIEEKVTQKLSSRADCSGPLETRHLQHLHEFHKQYLSEEKREIILSEKPPSLQVYEYPSLSDSTEATQSVIDEQKKRCRKIHRKRRLNDNTENSKPSKLIKRHKKDRSDLDEHESSDEESRDILAHIINAVQAVQKERKCEEKILSSLESLEANWDQLKNTPSVDPCNEALDFNRIGLPPVAGYRRKNGEAELEIHVGQNIWIAEKIYNSVVNSAQKSNAVFVKEMALKLFGEDLRNRTVTGMKAPKTGIKSDALDGTKVTAIREIFIYFLQTQRYMKNRQIRKEITKIKDYLREKINDIKKPSRAKQDVDGAIPNTSCGKEEGGKTKPSQAVLNLISSEDTSAISDGNSAASKKLQN